MSAGALWRGAAGGRASAWLGGAALVLAAGAATPASGALGPRHGGSVTFPAPAQVARLDPTRAETAFEATLNLAVFDGLYEADDRGTVRPVLADGPPEIDGLVARVRLREGVVHHGGRPLLARHVVRSLLRASAHGGSAWLLGALASEAGRPVIREVDERTVEFQLARRGVRIARLLAAPSLAIVVGGNLGRAPLGTGPFRARLEGAGRVRLRRFRRAVDGCPWLNEVRFAPAGSRDDEVRAFELGRLDGSFEGRSVYGGEPVRPVSTATGRVRRPWLLLRNAGRALRADRDWGGVAASIDRARLERLSVVPSRTLGESLPAPRLPEGALRPGLTLRLIARTDRPSEVRIGEAIRAMLDERGARVELQALSAERYEAALSAGRWDLRLASTRPPLPGAGPAVGAALAAAGQLDRAREIAARMRDRAAVAEAARTLDAMVLGDQRAVFHHRADLLGVLHDRLGRLSLADLSFARTVEPLR